MPTIQIVEMIGRTNVRPKLGTKTLIHTTTPNEWYKIIHILKIRIDETLQVLSILNVMSVWGTLTNIMDDVVAVFFYSLSPVKLWNTIFQTNKLKNTEISCYYLCALCCAGSRTEDINQKNNSENCHQFQNIKFIMHGDAFFFNFIEWEPRFMMLHFFCRIESFVLFNWTALTLIIYYVKMNVLGANESLVQSTLFCSAIRLAKVHWQRIHRPNLDDYNDGIKNS